MDTPNFFMYIGASVLAVVITAFIFALVFNVKKQMKLMQMQIDLLTKIAEKSGVESQEISQIVNA